MTPRNLALLGSAQYNSKSLASSALRSKHSTQMNRIEVAKASALQQSAMLGVDKEVLIEVASFVQKHINSNSESLELSHCVKQVYESAVQINDNKLGLDEIFIGVHKLLTNLVIIARPSQDNLLTNSGLFNKTTNTQTMDQFIRSIENNKYDVMAAKDNNLMENPDNIADDERFSDIKLQLTQQVVFEVQKAKALRPREIIKLLVYVIDQVGIEAIPPQVDFAKEMCTIIPNAVGRLANQEVKNLKGRTKLLAHIAKLMKINNPKSLSDFALGAKIETLEQLAKFAQNFKDEGIGFIYELAVAANLGECETYAQYLNTTNKTKNLQAYFNPQGDKEPTGEDSEDKFDKYKKAKKLAAFSTFVNKIGTIDAVELGLFAKMIELTDVEELSKFMEAGLSSQMSKGNKCIQLVLNFAAGAGIKEPEKIAALAEKFELNTADNLIVIAQNANIKEPAALVEFLRRIMNSGINVSRDGHISIIAKGVLKSESELKLEKILKLEKVLKLGEKLDPQEVEETEKILKEIGILSPDKTLNVQVEVEHVKKITDLKEELEKLNNVGYLGGEARKAAVEKAQELEDYLKTVEIRFDNILENEKVLELKSKVRLDQAARIGEFMKHLDSGRSLEQRLGNLSCVARETLGLKSVSEFAVFVLNSGLTDANEMGKFANYVNIVTAIKVSELIEFVQLLQLETVPQFIEFAKGAKIDDTKMLTDFVIGIAKDPADIFEFAVGFDFNFGQLKQLAQMVGLQIPTNWGDYSFQKINEKLRFNEKLIPEEQSNLAEFGTINNYKHPQEFGKLFAAAGIKDIEDIQDVGKFAQQAGFTEPQQLGRFAAAACVGIKKPANLVLFAQYAKFTELKQFAEFAACAGIKTHYDLFLFAQYAGFDSPKQLGQLMAIALTSNQIELSKDIRARANINTEAEYQEFTDGVASIK